MLPNLKDTVSANLCPSWKLSLRSSGILSVLSQGWLDLTVVMQHIDIQEAEYREKIPRLAYPGLMYTLHGSLLSLTVLWDPSQTSRWLCIVVDGGVSFDVTKARAAWLPIESGSGKDLTVHAILSTLSNGHCDVKVKMAIWNQYFRLLKTLDWLALCSVLKISIAPCHWAIRNFLPSLLTCLRANYTFFPTGSFVKYFRNILAMFL